MMKTTISASLLAAGISALAFSGAVSAYASDNYLKSLKVQPVDFSLQESDEYKKKTLEDLSIIHFAMVDHLQSHTKISEFQAAAKSVDAMTIIDQSALAKQAWIRLSFNLDMTDYRSNFEADGHFSLEDALIFSRSVAKAAYLKP